MGKYREIMDEWFVRVWGEGDTACIYEKCAENLATTGHRGHPLSSPKEFEEFHTIISSLVKDIDMKITQSVENEEWFSMIYEFNSTSIKTGKPVTMTGSSMVRFENGKIIEAHEHANFIEFFQGLDALPVNTLELGFTGNKIIMD